MLHISLLNTTVVAFKVLRLGSYAPIPVPSPPFKTILKPVLWNCLQSCRCITPVSSMSSKCLPFSISYIFGNKKKSLEGLDPVNRQGVPKQLLFSSQNLPHRRCRVSRCIVVMQDTWVVGKKFGSFPSKSFTQPFQCFQLVNFVDCLSSWYKFIMIPLISKKSQQHCFGSWFGPTDFFFLVVGNWQSSIVHFATSFQGRIGRPMFHHLWWHGPKCNLASPNGLGKFWL